MSSASTPSPNGPQRSGKVLTGDPARPTDTPPEYEAWVQFRRGPNYAGEYGFDWVKWDMTTGGITHVQDVAISNYAYHYVNPAQGYVQVTSQLPHLVELLECEHLQFPVYTHRYYIPWLSLKPPRGKQPGQSVTLELVVEPLNTEPMNGDFITFSPNAQYKITVAGQSNNGPTPIRLLAHKQKIPITIECIAAGPATTLKALDEHNTEVGRIEVAANDAILPLALRVVQVLMGAPMDATVHPPVLYVRNPKAPASLAARMQAMNIEDYLNNHLLNQAGVEVTLSPTTYEVLIDPVQWATKGYYDASNKCLIDDGSLAEYMTIAAASKYTTDPVYTAFKGITLYACELSLANPGVRASGTIFPVEASNLKIYRSGLDAPKSETVAHELGHVLGLHHAFYEPAEDASTSYAQKIQGIDLSRIKQEAVIFGIEREIENYNNLPVPVLDMAGGANASIEAMILAERNARKANAQNRLAKAKNDLATIIKSLNFYTTWLRVYEANKYRFVKLSTENIMDYSLATGSPDGRSSLWHWQWEIIQNEIKNYY